MENQMPSPVPIPGRRSRLRRMSLTLASFVAVTSLLGFSAAGASAAVPTVTTNAATSVTASSATLNGYISDGTGLWTQYRFEYGKTAAYGLTTEWISGGKAGFFGNVNATIKSLENYEYHFRLVAKNQNGTGFGADKTFEYMALWHLGEPSVNPAADISRFKDVSCVPLPALECFGVGSSESSGSGSKPLAERFDSKGWQLQTTPEIASTGHSLESVSCLSAKYCVAVGYQKVGLVKQVLIERWNGTEWQFPEFFALPAGTTELYGVSCVAETHAPLLAGG